MGNVRAVAFSPDGKTALTGRTYEPAAATLWGCPLGLVDVVPGVQAPGLKAMVFSPGGRMLATIGADDVAHVWDLAGVKQLGPPLRHDRGGVTAIVFSPDGETVATGGRDLIVRLWDTRTGAPRGRPMPQGQMVYALAFSPDGKTLLVGCQSDQIRVCDVTSGNVRRPPAVKALESHGLAFLPNGRTFLVANNPGPNQQWDLATCQPRGELFRPEEGVTALALAPGGTRLAITSPDQNAYLVDAATGRLLHSPLQHPDHIRTVGFTEDGQILVTGGADGAVRLWDVATGLRVGPLLSHTGPVLAAFQPRSEKVAAIARDGLLRLWDVPRPAAGDAATVRQWVETLTGKKLAESGILHTRVR
jgi:WD40 repeat protein